MAGVLFYEYPSVKAYTMRIKSGHFLFFISNIMAGYQPIENLAFCWNKTVHGKQVQII